MRLRTTGMVMLAAAMLGSVGCVAQQKADSLTTLYRQSQEQVQDLKSQLDDANAAIAALKAQKSENPALLKQIDALKSQRDRLQTALNEAENQLRNAASGPILPPELNDALAQLAAQHPGLMTYDAKLGMVKFQSDLTFDLGSATVKAGARQTLDRLAEVLKSPAAGKYEVRIVGHTDNVPVRNPRTKAKHPNNWYLSADRAIGVEAVLEKAGVPPTRMSVAGYSQYRPVVANGAHGAQANRRVEIYLLPMKQASAVQSSAPAAGRNAAPATPAPRTEHKQNDQFLVK